MTSDGLYDKTECVQDNNTGLVWEGKNPTGSSSRLWNTQYTNLDSTASAQKLNGTNPTQAEIDAPTNSIGYMKSVNAGSGLCGYTDWRIPTKEELIGIRDATQPSPYIDPTWFPNTFQDTFWSSTPTPNHADYAIGVGFFGGTIESSFIRFGGLTRLSVRLVRGNQ